MIAPAWARGYRREWLRFELRLANVREPALEILQRAGIAQRVRIEPTLDQATR